jgi:hypothetical protein
MRVVSFDVGIKNLAFAVAVVGAAEGGGAAAVERWGTVCLCASSARALTKQAAVELVVRALDELDFLECDVVLVESQPRFAPQNVHVAHAIATYFVVRKRADLDEPVAVHFVHASLKNALSVRVLGHRAALDRTCTAKYAKYARNKRQAVAACEALVAPAGDWLRATWDALAKKDDAADAMLQLVAWTGARALAAAPTGVAAAPSSASAAAP